MLKGAKKTLIYLDNSSTTHKKPRQVIHATKLGLTKYSVNASRGGYNLAIKGGMQVLNVREQVARHFGANIENVIFTESCTGAINLGLRGTVKKGGHIITTAMEHNSTLRTIEDLKKQGLITYIVVEPKNGIIDPCDIEKEIKPNTYLVTCIHVSNVTGNENNIFKVGQVCKKHNLKLFVDCAQSAGHKRINMKDNNINLISFAGHKGFYAPQGIGGLVYRDITVLPIKTGGTGTFSESIVQPTEPPEGLESGTQSIPCILGLGAGIKYVEKHFKQLNNRIYSLSSYLFEQLKTMPDYKVYSLSSNNGVIAINHKKHTSSEVGDHLNKYGICIRSGLHCAPLVHRSFGTTKTGMVRISIGGFNKMHEIKVLIKALKSLK